MSSAKANIARDEDIYEEFEGVTEHIEMYRPGKFHPVHLGDYFGDGRYQILRKFGAGSFSTKCPVDVYSATRYVAIKVLPADAHINHETGIYQKLSCDLKDHPGRDHVMTLVSHFDHQGPHGNHHCLIFEVMGANAAAIVEGYDSGPGGYILPYWMSKSILRQILLGLDFLHCKGITHGDLQWGNILFQAIRLDSAYKNDLFQKDSIRGPIRRLDGKIDPGTPKYLAEARSLEEYADLTPGFSIKISDLGGAFFFSQPPAKPTTPLGLRTPELILSRIISRTQDVWSLGCLIFEFITGRPLLVVERGWSNMEAMMDVPPLEKGEITANGTQESTRSPNNGANGTEILTDADYPNDKQNHLLGLEPNSAIETSTPRADPLDGNPDEQKRPEPNDQPKANHADKLTDTSKELTLDEEADDEHLVQFIALLGPLPLALQSKWQRYSLHFDEHGHTKDPRLVNGAPLEDVPIVLSLAEMIDRNVPAYVPAEEKDMIQDLLHKLLRYEPDERPSASELLKHPWFEAQDLEALKKLDDRVWKNPKSGWEDGPFGE